MSNKRNTNLCQRGTFFKTIAARLLLAVFLSVSAGTAIGAGMELQSVEDGSDTNLDSLIGQGKWTLVMIWSTNCHICHIDKPEISAFHDAHKNDDAHVIGIALDGPDRVDTVSQYIEDNNVSFPSYVTDSLVLASHYYGMTEENLRGTPTYLLFGPDGQLLGNNPGRLSVEAIESFIERKSS